MQVGGWLEAGRASRHIRKLTVPERAALVRMLEGARWEVIPLKSAEEKVVAALPPGATVTITSSPREGRRIPATLDLTARLAGHGFRVVPHIAARLVQDRSHLEGIVTTLTGLGVTAIFVCGGDGAALGEYDSAIALLRDLAGMDCGFEEVGVAAYPERHPLMSTEEAIEVLRAKQPFATNMTTQMAFAAPVIGEWVEIVRTRGIGLPAYLGIPGSSDVARLLRISAQIGVGSSVRYLQKNTGLMRRVLSPFYTATGLVSGLARYTAAPGIAGFHVFTFNQVQSTVAWRDSLLERLRAASGGSTLEG